MPEASKRNAFKISDGITTHVLVHGDLTPGDAGAVRKLIGVSLSRLLQEEQFDADTILILWWLAQVQNGAQHLKYEDVVKTYPNLTAISAFSIDVIEDVAEDGEDSESPLGSGAA